MKVYGYESSLIVIQMLRLPYDLLIHQPVSFAEKR
jgi:hypothetical protein